jgi:hypothetical protein
VFRVTAKNMGAFASEQERDFEERVVRRLRDNFDHLRDAGDEALTALVRRGRARAATYGIDTMYGISLFVGLMAQLGEDFDVSGAHPWVTEIFEHQHLTGTARVEWIYDLAMEKEAARRSTSGDGS